MGWLVAAVLMAALGGTVGGGITVLGLVEALAGRMVINIRQLPWSRQDVQVIGLCRVVQGSVIAAEGICVAIITATQLGPATRFLLPVLRLLTVVMGAALTIPAGLQVHLSRRTGVPLL